MHRPISFALAGLLLSASGAAAGPERVAFPAGYQDGFVRYMDVDRPDRKIKRLFYVNPTALEAAKAGDPLPNGTVQIGRAHSELQSLMRISYAVFCLKKQKQQNH